MWFQAAVASAFYISKLTMNLITHVPILTILVCSTLVFSKDVDKITVVLESGHHFSNFEIPAILSRSKRAGHAGHDHSGSDHDHSGEDSTKTSELEVLSEFELAYGNSTTLTNADLLDLESTLKTEFSMTTQTMEIKLKSLKIQSFRYIPPTQRSNHHSRFNVQSKMVFDVVREEVNEAQITESIESALKADSQRLSQSGIFTENIVVDAFVEPVKAPIVVNNTVFYAILFPLLAVMLVGGIVWWWMTSRKHRITSVSMGEMAWDNEGMQEIELH